MARVCDICGGKIGWKAFHCQDGAICKECYKLVSNGYTTTITGKTLAELKKAYVKNAKPLALGQDGFTTSRKVGSFLILDEEHKKFCLPSNYRITGQYAQPEIFPWKKLKGYKLVSDPELSPERLSTLSEDKKTDVVIKSLVIRLKIAGAEIKDIVFIPKPVRASSFAFRKAYSAAKEVMKELTCIIYG